MSANRPVYGASYAPADYNSSQPYRYDIGGQLVQVDSYNKQIYDAVNIAPTPQETAYSGSGNGSENNQILPSNAILSDTLKTPVDPFIAKNAAILEPSAPFTKVDEQKWSIDGIEDDMSYESQPADVSIIRTDTTSDRVTSSPIVSEAIATSSPSAAIGSPAAKTTDKVEVVDSTPPEL